MFEFESRICPAGGFNFDSIEAIRPQHTFFVTMYFIHEMYITNYINTNFSTGYFGLFLHYMSC